MVAFVLEKFSYFIKFLFSKCFRSRSTERIKTKIEAQQWRILAAMVFISVYFVKPLSIDKFCYFMWMLLIAEGAIVLGKVPRLSCLSSWGWGVEVFLCLGGSGEMLGWQIFDSE